MKKNVFLFNDYKEYLLQRLDSPEYGGGRGRRSQLSKAIKCQTAYTAQVLRGSAHFSLEQAESINEFLGHNESESVFFLMLIQWNRAGTFALRERFKKLVQEAKLQQANLKNRVERGRKMSDQNTSIYYSSWIYGGVHALASIDKYKTPEKIADYFNLPLKKINEVIDFLTECDILKKQKNGQLEIGSAILHLPADSEFITKHHLNWRLKCINSLEITKTSNMHYSSVISISQTDEDNIREILIQAIQSMKKIIRDSKEEKVKSLCFDFFDV